MAINKGKSKMEKHSKWTIYKKAQTTCKSCAMGYCKMIEHSQPNRPYMTHANQDVKIDTTQWTKDIKVANKKYI